MPEKGIEFSRSCGHRILSLARLPVPPLPHNSGLTHWPAKSNRIKHSHRSDGYAAGDYPSPLMKRPKPDTSCTNCRVPGYSIHLANGKCGRMVNWKRCKGTNQSAIQEKDWAECPSCAGSGYEGAARCIHCDSASGWVFVRGRKL